MYDVGLSVTWYSANIHITQNGIMRTLPLTPASPVGRSEDRNVSAVIIGNMAPSIALPTFADNFLVIPDKPAYSARVVDGMVNWMFVEKTRFDLDGNTCNKIGVSYNAFQAESNKCANTVGSCLGNQLDALWSQDVIKKLSGQTPSLLLERFGNFKLYPKTAGAGAPVPQVGLIDPQLRNVILQLEINADDLIFINYRSSGVILDVKVAPFVAGFSWLKTSLTLFLVARFPAQSYGGRATVTVQNTGPNFALQGESG